MNSVNLHHAQGTWSCTGRSGHLEPYPVTMNGGTGREGIFELRPLANGAWEICGYREDKKHPDHITKVEKTLATEPATIKRKKNRKKIERCGIIYF